MKIEKLFNVLILSGAAVGLAACSDDGGGNGGAGAAGSTGATSANTGSGGEGGGESASSGGGGEGDGGATAGSGGATAGSGGATAGSGGGDGAGGASSLECSVQPAPDDACGCPCCWMGGCLNNEPCCAAFCSAGNNGEGCCDG